MVGDVTPDMEIVREEIFGPVAALVRFDTEADAIKLANDTPFGLAAYLFSQNMSRAWRVAEKLDAGMVGVNEGIFSNEVVPVRGRQGIRPWPRRRRRGLGGVSRDQIHLPGRYRCIIGRSQAEIVYGMSLAGLVANGHTRWSAARPQNVRAHLTVSKYRGE